MTDDARYCPEDEEAELWVVAHQIIVGDGLLEPRHRAWFRARWDSEIGQRKSRKSRKSRRWRIQSSCPCKLPTQDNQ